VPVRTSTRFSASSWIAFPRPDSSGHPSVVWDVGSEASCLDSASGQMLPHSPPFRNSEFGGRHTELTAASPRRVTGRLWCADAGAARKLAGPPRPGSHTGRQGQPTGTAHFPPLIRRNRRAGAGGLISSRMASNTTLNWASYFRSSSPDTAGWVPRGSAAAGWHHDDGERESPRARPRGPTAHRTVAMGAARRIAGRNVP